MQVTAPAISAANDSAAPSRVAHWSERFGFNYLNISLFLLFCAYGPALNVLGQFRYVELVIIVAMVLFYPIVMQRLKDRAGVFVGLFLLAAMSQMVSDGINNAPSDGSIKRLGTYVVLAVMVLGLRWIVNNNPNRMRWISIGYGISYFFVLLHGYAAIELYFEAPWRLGLGFGLTMAIAAIASWFNKGALWGGLALLAMAAIHTIAEGRALGLFTGMAGAASVYAYFFGSALPSRATWAQALGTLAGVVLFFAGLIQLLHVIVSMNVLPSDLQAKMDGQLNSSYGLLASARPDTFTAMYAISKRPVFGFGTSAFDIEVHGVYVELASAAYENTEIYDGFREGVYNMDDMLGIPSHSHLFGAWAESGFLATLGWWFTLGVAGVLFLRSLRWNNPFVPLYMYITLNTFWDVLFSPGPHRLDIALRIVIMLYGLAHLDALDRFADKQKKLALEAREKLYREVGRTVTGNVQPAA